MDFERLERKLKERWRYPYRWGRKQSDTWDRMTRFIYETYGISKLKERCEGLPEGVFDYALNRWYNFWSAQAIEALFGKHPRVVPHPNRFEKKIDFYIDAIPFDHKTSVFPKGFGGSYQEARNDPKALIRWLYEHQSQEGRKHMANRLFIVLYDGIDGAHWKMKAEIGLIARAIRSYLDDFDRRRLYRLDFGSGEILSDIIWVVREQKDSPRKE